MSALGRWNGTDPLADKNYRDSPYVYVVNNPLNYLDPTGRDTTGPGNRRLSQEDVIGYWTTVSSGGVNSIRGRLKAVEASKALQGLTRAETGATVAFAALDVYLDPSRENVVEESSKLGGALLGGKFAMTLCAAAGSVSAGTGAVSCVILVAGGAVAGSMLGEKYVGDTINEWFGDDLNSLFGIPPRPDDPSPDAPADDPGDTGDSDTEEDQPDGPDDED